MGFDFEVLSFGVRFRATHKGGLGLLTVWVLYAGRVLKAEALGRRAWSQVPICLCRVYLDPKDPTFLGFLNMNSLYNVLKTVGHLGLR